MLSISILVFKLLAAGLAAIHLRCELWASVCTPGVAVGVTCGAAEPWQSLYLVTATTPFCIFLRLCVELLSCQTRNFLCAVHALTHCIRWNYVVLPLLCAPQYVVELWPTVASWPPALVTVPHALHCLATGAYLHCAP